MVRNMRLVARAAGVAALNGCATGGGSAVWAGAACIQWAQKVMDGSANRVRSELSKADTLVIVGANNDTRGRCLSSSDGRVTEFRLM